MDGNGRGDMGTGPEATYMASRAASALPLAVYAVPQAYADSSS